MVFIKPYQEFRGQTIVKHYKSYENSEPLYDQVEARRK